MAAPMATASSGLTDLFGVFPKNLLTNSYTFGILVDPPTNNTSSIFSFVKPLSLIQFSHGLIVFFKKSSHNESNLALEMLRFKCFGPVASAVK